MRQTRQIITPQSNKANKQTKQHKHPHTHTQTNQIYKPASNSNQDHHKQVKREASKLPTKHKVNTETQQQTQVQNTKPKSNNQSSPYTKQHTKAPPTTKNPTTKK